MAATPVEFTLELKPETRLAVIDIARRLTDFFGDALAPYPKHLYCSYHTTAGYLEQGLCARLGHDLASVEAYVHSGQRIFPAGAPYRHDQLDLRTELTDEQRLVEPRNADSHLTFIGLGLENCVTYDNVPERPVYFIDLDGVNGVRRRLRRTTVVGFNDEALVAEHRLAVPVSGHAIDSVSLRDPRLGLMDELNHLLARYDLAKGRLVLSLDPSEHHAALTVNEYETLLMQHDLAEVLRNPLRFMAEKGMNMLRDPLAIRSKAKNYAKYDLVQVVNEVIDTLRLNESLVERVIDRFMAASASRRLRLKRSVTLFVNHPEGQAGGIVQGTYQSPILVQWRKAAAQTRHITVRLYRFA